MECVNFGGGGIFFGEFVNLLQKNKIRFKSDFVGKLKFKNASIEYLNFKDFYKTVPVHWPFHVFYLISFLELGTFTFTYFITINVI